MHRIYEDVNFAFPDLVELLQEDGWESGSRNGEVVTLDTPIMVTIKKPVQRVLLDPVRRINPFLFLLDGLSVLSNVNLLKPFTDITPRFREYSDDGIHLRGHYGRRLRGQISTALQMLQEQPLSRRVVLSIWDRMLDLGVESRDIPCNVMVIPRIVHRQTWDENLQDYIKHTMLDLTVINRSNDLIWGMMGANIVQFSFLQEYMAAMLGVEIGELHQFSTNLHFYTQFGPGQKIGKAVGDHPFRGEVEVPLDYPPFVPLDPTDLLPDLDLLFMALAVGGPIPQSRNRFITWVVHPMLQAWREQSAKCLDAYPPCDWFDAARLWFKEI